MRVLITGATGHLGANLVREALAEGHQVRALVRRSSDRVALRGLEIETAEGDLLDPDSLAAAMSGVEVVHHAAAVYRNWARDEEAEIVRPSVEGTAHVLRAASAAGVARVVHCSSNATIGYPRSREPWDESHRMEGAKSAYIRAKCLAERLGLGASLGVEVVVVNPCGNLGPWDLRLTPTTTALREMAGGGPSVLDLAITHVADLSRGMLLAAAKGRPGERYLLSGDNCTREWIAETLTELTGRRVKAMQPPWLVMRLIAWNEERKARNGSARDAGLTADQLADVWGGSLFYDSTRARTELGWSARPAREVLVDSLSWLAFRRELPEDVAQRVLAARPADPTWPARD